jgi:hypothetical protein
MSVASKGEDFNLDDPDSNLNALSGGVGGAYCAVDGEINEELWSAQFASAGVFSGKEDVFLRVAEETGIDPVLMAAIALHETGYGTSSAVVEKNNPGGLMGSGGLFVFDTLEEGIESMGQTLHNRIIKDGLVTITDLGSVYAPIGASNDPTNLNVHWVPNVTKVVSSLGGLTMNCEVLVGDFVQPIPNVVINSNFGIRVHPVTGEIKAHEGVDLAVSQGTPIVATEAGKVTYSGWASGYGNFISIDHGGGYASRYGHASALLVRSGQSVKKGQLIALVGSTGHSTGPHLHFELVNKGKHQNPLALINKTVQIATH